MSFKFRAPVEVSHVWITDKVAKIPFAIRAENGIEIKPTSVPANLPSIEILTPFGGRISEHVCDVKGVTKGGYVAVYVFSEDGMWYRQKLTSTSDKAWSSSCVLGRPETGAGWTFKIVAIRTEEPFLDHEPKSALPAGTTSNIVELRRL